MINKLLIANRGEIAVRIIKTARELGMKTLSVYAEGEAEDWHVQMAEESVNLGKGSLQETFLSISRRSQIALEYHCDAIHPGYGFLSENPALAESCVKNNIRFIGPDAKAITLMGNKVKAKEIARGLNIPMIDQYHETVNPDKLNYPVIIKTAGGGGGKGMAIVSKPEELSGGLQKAKSAGKKYFNDDQVFIEDYFPEARHIEVQIMADRQGNVISLYERECSVQRNYQKLIEEAPSNALSHEQRIKISNDAVNLAKAIKYQGAGTVEFLLDKNGNHYFMEMNTRIQVEHPVTEMVTGIDMVKWQLLVAQGFPIPLRQEDIIIKGHAIEIRLYAEDPEENYQPSPGRIYFFKNPESKNIRVDAAIQKKGWIHHQYDPTIAKIISHATSREEARLKLVRALNETKIHGIKSNKPFLKEILNHHDFVNENVSITFLERAKHDIIEKIREANRRQDPSVPILASILSDHFKHSPNEKKSPWNSLGPWRILQNTEIKLNDNLHQIRFIKLYDKALKTKINGKNCQVVFLQWRDNIMYFSVNNQVYQAHITYMKQEKIIEIDNKMFNIKCNILDNNNFIIRNKGNEYNINETIFSPIAGKIVKIFYKNDEHINKGDVIMVIESMKIENQIKSPFPGVIKDLNVMEGKLVSENMALLKLNPA